MEQDYNQQLNREVLELEQQLRETIAAENFFESSVGKLFQELATKEITRITRDVTSEKYRKDFAGYNNALSDLMAYKRILRSMQVAASPVRKAEIKEKLDFYEKQ